MHAFLIIGDSKEELTQSTKDLAKKLCAKIMEFPLVKIDDVRNLNSLLKLKFNENTLIVSQNIHKAGEEALNAFLKNLEEPQENIYFVITAPSIKKVLPTIVSRCQIMYVSNTKSETANEEINSFIKMSKLEKISYIDKIKDRAKAIEFVEDILFFMHGSLHKNELKCKFEVREIELTLKTLSRLNANGNVNLQLSNFVINLN